MCFVEKHNYRRIMFFYYHNKGMLGIYVFGNWQIG